MRLVNAKEVLVVPGYGSLACCYVSGGVSSTQKGQP